jgi:hypothetical protein
MKPITNENTSSAQDAEQPETIPHVYDEERVVSMLTGLTGVTAKELQMMRAHHNKHYKALDKAVTELCNKYGTFNMLQMVTKRIGAVARRRKQEIKNLREEEVDYDMKAELRDWENLYKFLTTIIDTLSGLEDSSSCPTGVNSMPG